MGPQAELEGVSEDINFPETKKREKKKREREDGLQAYRAEKPEREALWSHCGPLLICQRINECIGPEGGDGGEKVTAARGYERREGVDEQRTW